MTGTKEANLHIAQDSKPDRDEAFEKALGKLVSNRNHFTGSDMYCEILLQLFRYANDKALSDEQVLVYAHSIFSRFADDCVWAYSTAARNGMEQAAQLICSPRYNEVLKKQHEREIAKQEAFSQEQKMRRAARKTEAIFKQTEGKIVQ